jgi:hypothetical protein
MVIHFTSALPILYDMPPMSTIVREKSFFCVEAPEIVHHDLQQIEDFHASFYINVQCGLGLPL